MDNSRQTDHRRPMPQASLPVGVRSLFKAALAVPNLLGWLLATGVSVAGGKFPTDGQVTFQTGGDARTPVLWRIQAKPGAQPENLTVKLDSIATGSGTDVGPITVSPDGFWYVFQSSRFGSDMGDGPVLTIAPADFSSAETVRNSGGVIYNEGMAQALSGGKVIVFSAGGGTHTRDLFVIRHGISGWGEPVSITTDSPFAFHSWPVLSPDGTKVLFNASDISQDGGDGTRIAEVKLDGTGFQVLVTPDDGPVGGSSTYCSFPAYTGDGLGIVFEATWNGSEQVWQRNLSGGAVSVLNNGFTNDNSPNSLPGGWIASLWLGSVTGNGQHEIKIMDSSGQNDFMLTSTNSPFAQVDDIGMGAGPLWTPQLAISQSGATIQVSWPARFEGFTLQASTTLAADSWKTVPATGNSATLDPAGSTQFLRLWK